MNSSRTGLCKSRRSNSHKAHKWQSWLAGDWVLLGVSLVLLPLVVIVLRLVGYRRTCDLLRWTSPSTTRPGRAVSVAQRYGRMINIAANHAPLRANCLPRSLFLWWCLRWLAYDATIRIGAMKRDGSLFAHAWVECQGVPVNDTADVSQRYLPFLPTGTGASRGVGTTDRYTEWTP